MKKITSIVTTFLFLSSLCFGGISDVTEAGQRNISDVTEPTALSRLHSMGGLTSFKDYANNQASLNADYSVGSPTATFTATRQATNSTYVDDDGVIKVSDTAVNRKNNYYDETGFHARSGVLLEPAGTNYTFYSATTTESSGILSGWGASTGGTVGGTPTYSTVAIDGLFIGKKSQRVIYNGQASDSGRIHLYIGNTVSVTAGNTYTASGWFRTQTGSNSQVSITIQEMNGTATNVGTSVTPTSSWTRWSVTRTVGAGVTGIRVTAGYSFGTPITSTSVVDLEFAFPQLESGTVGTSFIPSSFGAVTRASDAPSTYVDASGVVQVNATNNTPRYQGGWYDSTGFHAGNKGLMAEPARTNYIPHSIFDADTGGLATGWTLYDNVTNAPTMTMVSETLTNLSGSRSQRWQQTFGDGTFSNLYSSNTAVGSFSQNEYITFSVYLKGTLTGITSLKLIIDEKDSSAVAGTQHASADLKASISSTAWTKILYSVQLVDADLSMSSSYINIAHAGSGSIDLQIAIAQSEKSPDATSFIPTTTSSMSRGAEKDSHVSAGNCTNAAETTLIKYAPFWAASAPTTGNYLLDSDADIVDLAFVAASDSFQYRPNGTDDAENVVLADSDPAINTSSVIAVVSYGATEDTNAEIYVDGVSKGTSTTNYTQPTIGTNFYIGSKADGTLQLGGVVQSIVKFGRALTSDEIVSATAILNS